MGGGARKRKMGAKRNVGARIISNTDTKEEW